MCWMPTSISFVGFFHPGLKRITADQCDFLVHSSGLGNTVGGATKGVTDTVGDTTKGAGNTVGGVAGGVGDTAKGATGGGKESAQNPLGLS